MLEACLCPVTLGQQIPLHASPSRQQSEKVLTVSPQELNHPTLQTRRKPRGRLHRRRHRSRQAPLHISLRSQGLQEELRGPRWNQRRLHRQNSSRFLYSYLNPSPENIFDELKLLVDLGRQSAVIQRTHPRTPQVRSEHQRYGWARRQAPTHWGQQQWRVEH